MGSFHESHVADAKILAELFAALKDPVAVLIFLSAKKGEFWSAHDMAASFDASLDWRASAVAPSVATILRHANILHRLGLLEQGPWTDGFKRFSISSHGLLLREQFVWISAARKSRNIFSP